MSTDSQPSSSSEAYHSLVEVDADAPSSPSNDATQAAPSSAPSAPTVPLSSPPSSSSNASPPPLQPPPRSPLPPPSPRPATPLPKLQVALIAVVLYSATFPQNVLFPFLPFMVAFFNPELSTSQLGYRAGVIASAFSVGTFFSSYLFGRLADRYGRKGCVLVGLLGTVLSSLMFGLSPNFAVAVIARLLAGMLCGNNGLAKTMISEITDDSNSAIAFALVGMMDGLARLSAPSIGGYLSQPNQEYGWGVEFFDLYPFFLPCFISAIVSVLGFLFVLPFLGETLPDSLRLANTRQLVRESHKKSAHAQPLWVLEADAREEAEEKAAKARKSPLALFRHREIRTMVLLNAILMVLALVINEGLPLWVVNDEEHFGFSFTASSIGAVFTVLGPMQSACQLLIYPRVTKRMGYLWTFRYCLFMVGVFCMLIPFTYYLSFSRALVWVGLVGGFVLLVLHRSSGFTTCFVVLNNVCTDEQKASANGLAMSVASLAGVVSPIVGGSMLAWSIDAGLPWPLDFSFMWTFCALFCALGYWLVSKMPQSANKKLHVDEKKAEETAEAEAGGGAVELGKVQVKGVDGVNDKSGESGVNGVSATNGTGVNGHTHHQIDER